MLYKQWTKEFVEGNYAVGKGGYNLNSPNPIVFNHNGFVVAVSASGVNSGAHPHFSAANVWATSHSYYFYNANAIDASGVESTHNLTSMYVNEILIGY